MVDVVVVVADVLVTVLAVASRTVVAPRASAPWVVGCEVPLPTLEWPGNASLPVWAVRPVPHQ